MNEFKFVTKSKKNILLSFSTTLLFQGHIYVITSYNSSNLNNVPQWSVSLDNKMILGLSH